MADARRERAHGRCERVVTAASEGKSRTECGSRSPEPRAPTCHGDTPRLYMMPARRRSLSSAVLMLRRASGPDEGNVQDRSGPPEVLTLADRLPLPPATRFWHGARRRPQRARRHVYAVIRNRPLCFRGGRAASDQTDPAAGLAGRVEAVGGQGNRYQQVTSCTRPRWRRGVSTSPCRRRTRGAQARQIDLRQAARCHCGQQRLTALHDGACSPARRSWSRRLRGVGTVDVQIAKE